MRQKEEDESNNIPVDEIMLLQVGHSAAHMDGHLQKHRRGENIPWLRSQVVKQVAVAHEFRNYVIGRLLSAHA